MINERMKQLAGVSLDEAEAYGEVYNPEREDKPHKPTGKMNMRYLPKELAPIGKYLKLSKWKLSGTYKYSSWAGFDYRYIDETLVATKNGVEMKFTSHSLVNTGHSSSVKYEFKYKGKKESDSFRPHEPWEGKRAIDNFLKKHTGKDVKEF
jgi:hypothetical protein